MKLTRNGIKNQELWEKAGIKLPGYDVEAVSEKAKKEPKWVHFGIGNIFRVFIGGIADGLLEEGALDRGITCVETFDYDVVDKIYEPYDNLGLSVILQGRDQRIQGSGILCRSSKSSVLRSGAVEAAQGNFCQSFPADGFFYDYGKGICLAESRWNMVSFCGI